MDNLNGHEAGNGGYSQASPGDSVNQSFTLDAVFHCKTEAEAEALKKAIEERLAQCKLELHPEKTKVVYCKDDNRQGKYPNEKFDFLGYTFRARGAKNRWGKCFVNFSPAVSTKASTLMRRTMRKWRLHLQSDKSLTDLSTMVDPILRGWINYYGNYHRSALRPIFQHLNHTLARWAMRKYKRLKGYRRRAVYGLGKIAKYDPTLFAHWQINIRPTAG